MKVNVNKDFMSLLGETFYVKFANLRKNVLVKVVGVDSSNWLLCKVDDKEVDGLCSIKDVCVPCGEILLKITPFSSFVRYFHIKELFCDEECTLSLIDKLEMDKQLEKVCAVAEETKTKTLKVYLVQGGEHEFKFYEKDIEQMLLKVQKAYNRAWRDCDGVGVIYFNGLNNEQLIMVRDIRGFYVD